MFRGLLVCFAIDDGLWLYTQLCERETEQDRHGPSGDIEDQIGAETGHSLSQSVHLVYCSQTSFTQNASSLNLRASVC